MREIIIPNNDKYLKIINNITISFNDKPKLSNLFLCYNYAQLTNNNKLEKQIISTTILLMIFDLDAAKFILMGHLKHVQKAFIK